MKRLTLVICVIASSLALAEDKTDAAVAKAEKDLSKDQDEGLAPTYSCSIHFPLDSVRFSEQRIEECFAGIDPKTISYIHVIATATPAGSNKHNLYLSTRRAGALEGYLRNRYPDTEIHAFGGGENPRAGKMARIIIVTRKIQKKTREKVVMYKPETVTKIKQVTKIEYQDRPAIGVNVMSSSGVTAGNNAYHFMGLRAAKRVDWGLENFSVGINYRMLRSNRLRDLTATGLFMSKHWLLKKLKQNIDVRVTATPILNMMFKKAPSETEGLAKSDNQSIDYGLGSAIEFIRSYYVLSLEAQYTSLYQSYGLGIGVDL
jgi:hypothetical protein